MAYVSLDPEGVQSLIDGLNGYKEQSERSQHRVTMTNQREDYPADLMSYTNLTGEQRAALEEQIRSLQARLEAARAANEGGITVTAPDGTISYYLPDGMEDTAENATAHNPVDTVAQARADAEALVDYSENGCTPEEWDALQERLTANQDNPVYANAMLGIIGPGRLLDLPNDIDGQLVVSRPGAADSSARPDAGTTLADTLGHILASASSTWSDEEAQAYGNRLVDHAEEEGKGERIGVLNQMLLASRSVDTDGDGTEESIGLDYSDALLVTLGTRLEGYSPQGTSDPRKGKRPTRPSVGPTDNPLAGLVHAMTGNPEAAQEWLVPPSEDAEGRDRVSAKEGVEITGRIQRLIEVGGLDNQQWTTDWALMADGIDRTSAQGSQTEDPALDDPERMASNNQAQMLAVSGILNGLGAGETPPDLSSQARRSVANVLARHPEGVDVSAEPGNPASPVGGNPDGESTSYYPVLTDRALSNLVGQISLDEAASSHLGDTMAEYHQRRLEEAAAHYQATGETGPLEVAARNQSTTNGFFAGAHSRQLISLAEQADARNEDFNTVTSHLASLLPGIGPGAGLAADLTDPVEVTSADEARNLANTVKDQRNDTNLDAITLTLINSGAYTPEELLAIAGLGSNRDASLAVVDEEGNVLTNGMTPDELASGEVDDGLSEMGRNLRVPGHPALDLGGDIEKKYSRGYDHASPQEGSAPSHEWDKREDES